MILENGVIRTMDPSLPVTRALAIAGDRIVGGVGAHETALPSPDLVDLGGRCVVPGFSDSHVHFPSWSLGLRDVSLDGATTLAEALDRIRAGPGDEPWIRAQGWRAAGWEAQPTKEALDEVTGGRPAALWAKDLHSLWLNSAALALAQGELDVDGGVVERDARGEPTGVLRENAAWRFRDLFPAVSSEEWLDVTREGMRLASSRGVTAVHDKDGWLGAPEIFQRLTAGPGLSLRVWQSVPYAKLPELEAVGLRSGVGDAYFRIGYLKVFMDGTLGSGTAWMLDGSGVVITSGDELVDIVRRGARAGWPVGVHAIGDRANREALDAFEATKDEWAPLGLRQRIEHAQCLALEDLPRFATLGVACSVQFSHAPSDRDLADRFWAERLPGTYAFRSLLESGAVLANGSDAPIEELDPLAGIRAAVTRTIDDRRGWRMEEALTVEQALHATTVAPAWLAGDERKRGKLLPGYLADLVVLSRDLVECPPEELESVEVVATMVGGRWVHNPPLWD
jgi:predicted amidohydrolase YtcJ